LETIYTTFYSKLEK